LPQVSELDAVRHYTNLSRRNFSIDTHFYPLGSCTMKYNPRACNALAMLPQFLARHPSAPAATGQGFLACMFELQEMLMDVTGMAGVSLAPMAGAQGEFAGVAMIRAYHVARGDTARTEILVPNAAHGTNPASAVMCGYTVREIPTDREGNVELAALAAAVGPHTAGLMLTNPSTLGVFERSIIDIRKIVHDAGGLLYYDGANLNAILGKVKPGDMGFDVIHINLHKTFSTPHGGGGPGAGPVGVATRLLPYLPVPMVALKKKSYILLGEQDVPQSIGRLSAHLGNAGVLLRAYIYARLLGQPGHAAGRRIRDAKRELPDGGIEEGGLRHRVPDAARQPRIHRDAEKAQGRHGRYRDGLREAPARQGLSRADHVFPVARARVPLDRAHRNRIEADARCVRAGDGGNPARSARAARSRESGAAHDAGAPARRRQGRARTRSQVAAGGGLKPPIACSVIGAGANSKAGGKTHVQ
jgi:hypothetical protein